MRSRLSRRDLVTLRRQPSDAGAQLVHIASLVVQLTPHAHEAVREVVNALPGAELHETAHPGKWVVVVESVNERATSDLAESLTQVSGVLTVAIVAHVMDSISALDEEVEG